MVLGRAWHGLGQLDIAETLLRRAVDTQQRVFGMQHPATLMTLNTLGLVLHDQSRIDEAVAALRDVIAGMRAFYGTPYFGNGRGLCGELVYALRDQGDWATIRELCEGWLERQEMPSRARSSSTLGEDGHTELHGVLVGRDPP